MFHKVLLWRAKERYSGQERFTSEAPGKKRHRGGGPRSGLRGLSEPMCACARRRVPQQSRRMPLLTAERSLSPCPLYRILHIPETPTIYHGRRLAAVQMALRPKKRCSLTWMGVTLQNTSESGNIPNQYSLGEALIWCTKQASGCTKRHWMVGWCTKQVSGGTNQLRRTPGALLVRRRHSKVALSYAKGVSCTAENIYA